ncbi:MAG: hypothetical protein V3S79_00925 [Candidatus Thermoplasmatota archaeon]
MNKADLKKSMQSLFMWSDFYLERVRRKYFYSDEMKEGVIKQYNQVQEEIEFIKTKLFGIKPN